MRELFNFLWEIQFGKVQNFFNIWETDIQVVHIREECFGIMCSGKLTGNHIISQQRLLQPEVL